MGGVNEPAPEAPDKRRAWALGDHWIAWLGACLILVASYVLTMVTVGGTRSLPARVSVAVVFAGLVALGAAAAHRAGKRALAVGLVGGYGVMTLVTGGQCTFFFPSGGLVGGLIYLFATILWGAALVVATLVSVVRRRV